MSGSPLSSIIYSPVVKTVGIFQQILQLSDFSSSIQALALGLLRLLVFLLIVNTEPFLPRTERLRAFHLLQHNRLQHLQDREIISGEHCCSRSPYLGVEILVNEPTSHTDAGTTEGEVSGVDPREDELDSLLEQVDEAHHSERLVEMVGNSQTDVQTEN